MAGAEEELDALRAAHAATMAVMGRVFDDETEEGRALITRVLQYGHSFLLIDGINAIIDDLEHLQRARAVAIERLRAGGDHYAATIVEGLA